MCVREIRWQKTVRKKLTREGKKRALCSGKTEAHFTKVEGERIGLKKWSFYPRKESKAGLEKDESGGRPVNDRAYRLVGSRKLWQRAAAP